MTSVVTLTFDIRSWDINQVTPRYKMKLFPTYEGNRPSGLGGDSGHTYTHRHTNRGATSINNIDNKTHLVTFWNIFLEVINPIYLHQVYVFLLLHLVPTSLPYLTNSYVEVRAWTWTIYVPNLMQIGQELFQLSSPVTLTSDLALENV